jgi:inward rectifier potassium channel
LRRERRNIRDTTITDENDIPKSGRPDVNSAGGNGAGEINRDLGLGMRVAQESRERFLNPDGTFNVRRHGLAFFQSLNLYHWLLTISWPVFFLLIALSYLAANLMFAAGYLLCGPGALTGLSDSSAGSSFGDAFFFSVQTVATIGYGRVTPNGLAANILVTLEALVGLLGFALATGLLFARFSRPDARIIFSDNAIIAPYRGMTALEFRIANKRNSQLINVEATVSISLKEMADGKMVRKFYPLKLERDKVVFFPLHWVIVHPIDGASPLRGMTQQQFDASDAEILILLSAVDETFAQTVHARSSYKYHDVRWGMRFSDIFHPSTDGKISIDLRRLSHIEPVGD